MPEYTVLAVLAVGAVVAAELAWARTGVFRRAQFWCAIAIVAFFQVLVDGWLTKLPKAIVLYSPEHITGVRFPFDIPIEDYLFGFAMVTLTIIVWQRRLDHRAARTEAAASANVASGAGGAPRADRPTVPDQPQ